MAAGLQHVHIRVNDSATGKPTPVRIRFTDEQGRYYPPLGRLAAFDADPRRDGGGNVLVDGRSHAYIPGSCEILLPPGKLHVEIHKGPDYLPFHQDFELIPGKLSLRWTIERKTDLRPEGWFAGDIRSHFLAPRAAFLEAQGEGLAVVHVQIREGEETTNTGETVASLSNILDFSGHEPALQTPDHLVTYDTFNESPLGCLGLLDCHRVVFPLKVREPIDWNLADWCGQCHRKGGFVVWSGWDVDLAGDEPGEGLANLLAGRIDALEFHPGNFDDRALALWYRLLDAGLHVPLVGGSAKADHSLPLGTLRTLARIDGNGPLSLPSWIAALRSGRTVATRGPFLRLEVDGVEPGGRVETTQRRVRARVRLEPWPLPVRIKILHGGETLLEADGIPNEPLDWAEELTIPETGWLAARCESDREILAHTSAIRLNPSSAPLPEAVAFVQERFDRFCSRVDGLDSRGGFASSRDTARLRDVLEEARRKIPLLP